MYRYSIKNMERAASGNSSSSTTTTNSNNTSNSNGTVNGMTGIVNLTSNTTQSPSAAIGERKRLKVQLTNLSCSIQINPKTWPNLREYDILEISSTTSSASSANVVNSSQLNRSHLPSNQQNNFNISQSATVVAGAGGSDEETTPILLQILPGSFNEAIPLDIIRIDSAINQSPFQFKNIYSFVNIVVVDKSTVTLDIVELLIREQYLNGSDMLRIKNHLQNTCVYLKKNIEFCGMKCSVRELWAPQCDLVSCGYIGEKTRLVFRSQSAVCTIYIQMSREMWEFDVNGEMYHEKAVNFLGELFANWKNLMCQHDVTIALFSRIFYNATSLDDFPKSARACINKDQKGRFYEDFYRVVYQNECYEDWMSTLIILKRLIKEYREYILNYHKQQLFSSEQLDSNYQMPVGRLSSAAEGNFLETLNLSSSVFERHFVDRPFDRTGMMSLVVTAGNGVFEVSKELSKITKERVIDNGIGSDLVCLGEQPLHSVPLFKYDDVGQESYNIPHWINLSFYKSSDTIRYCNSKFLPSAKIKVDERDVKNMAFFSETILPHYSIDKNNYLQSLEDTDNIFQSLNKISLPTGLDSQITFSSTKKIIPKHGTLPSIASSESNFKKKSDNDSGVSSLNLNSAGDESEDGIDDSFVELDSENEQSINEQTRRSKLKTQINPFQPSSLKPRMSFERRRWAHAFPLRPDGTPIYSHWVTVRDEFEQDPMPINYRNSTRISTSNYSSAVLSIKNSESNSKVSPDSSSQSIANSSSSKSQFPAAAAAATADKKARNSITNRNLADWKLMNNDDSKATTTTTGVAWKSLTIPASLPLTTDFCPRKETWNKYLVCTGNYNLLLDEIREQYNYVKYKSERPITMADVFQELVGHRLAMGFQMVVPKSTFTHSKAKASETSTGPQFLCDLNSSKSLISRSLLSQIKGYCKLSFGRIYHELFYIVESNRNDYVKVEIYIPRKEINTKKMDYKYRFQVPDSRKYDISFCEISRKNIESIKWNLIDTYLCIQGNGSLTPSDLQKCWRQRIYLIPLMYVQNKLQSTAAGNIKQPSLASSNSNSNASMASSQNNQPSENVISSPTKQVTVTNLISQQKMVLTHGDVYQRKSQEELRFIRDYYFIKFMEVLNKLTRADDRRVFSRSTLSFAEQVLNNPSSSNQDSIIAVVAIMNAHNNTQISNASLASNIVSKPQVSQTLKPTTSKRLPSPHEYLFPMLEQYLANLNKPIQPDNIANDFVTIPVQNDALKQDIYNYLNKEYKEHMLNGFPFIEKKTDIPINCFISAEAVWWCIENINQVDNEADAITIMQIMGDFDLIRHISLNLDVFIHGFYLYYIIVEQNSKHDVYSKDYCEVGYCDIDYYSKNNEIPKTAPEALVYVKDLPNNLKALPTTGSDMLKSYMNIFKKYSSSKFNNDSILRLVNVDVDVGKKSNRIEWASAVYRSHYHQLCAFELEIQWEIATGQLLSELVNSWAKASNKFNYHIVPAPIDPFAMPIVENSDPLRGPIYVKLNLNCLLQDQAILFENLIDVKYKSLFKLIETTRNQHKRPDSSLDISPMTRSPNPKANQSAFLLPDSSSRLSKLLDSYPEFKDSIMRKYDEKQLIEQDLLDDCEFVENELVEFIERERIFHLQYFQEAILEKYGFIRNAAVVKTLVSDDDPSFFIHSSGGMFVFIPNYYANYSLRSRHPSSNTNNQVTNTYSTDENGVTIMRTVANNNNQPIKHNILEHHKSLFNKDSIRKDNRSITENNISELNEKLQGCAINASELGTSPNNVDFHLAPTHSKTGSMNFNSSLSNSYISSGAPARERSHTKSQHIQFLKLNQYLNNPSSSLDSLGGDLSDLAKHFNDSSANQSFITAPPAATTGDVESGNDLLFKPKSIEPRSIKKSNDKYDLFQQQQREHTQPLPTDAANSSLTSLSDALTNTNPNSTMSPNVTINQSLLTTNNQPDIFEGEPGKMQPFYADQETFIGFLWSWNFMMGKRWRSQFTGDDIFQDNMLADFILFCANSDGRLENFYKESKACHY